MQDVVICGAGGFGREVLEILKSQNENTVNWNILGFIDDTIPKGQMVNGFPILGNIDWFCTNHNNVGCLVAVGDTRVKRKIIEKLEMFHVNFVNAIHPSVIMSDSVEIGKNVIICAGCILTVNIKIGNHVILNLSSTVGHDVIIEDYCSIMPSVKINGNTHVKQGAYIGSGATIIQDTSVGCWSIIGAGAVVVKEISNRVTAVGIPAKPVKAHLE
jgi:sugar O-acyltransferase (sialic acid O-acetyltransferase NeuD family)